MSEGASGVSSAPASWLARPANARLISLGLGLPAWGVLGIAAYLSPDPRGFGTHQQLGLTTCTVMRLTGQPCPMCGMTTCFAHMAHLEPLQALLVQPFGVVLFLTTLGIALASAAELLQPRGRWQRLWDWVGPREGRVAAGVVAGLLLGWIYKLWQLA